MNHRRIPSEEDILRAMIVPDITGMDVTSPSRIEAMQSTRVMGAIPGMGGEVDVIRVHEEEYTEGQQGEV